MRRCAPFVWSAGTSWTCSSSFYEGARESARNWTLWSNDWSVTNKDQNMICRHEDEHFELDDARGILDSKLNPTQIRSERTQIHGGDPTGSIHSKRRWHQSLVNTTTVHRSRRKLRKMKTSRTPGPDDIISRLIWERAEQLCGMVTHMFSLSFTSEVLWQTSQILCWDRNPLHLMKPLERIIHSHVSSAVGPLQFAWRPKVVDDGEGRWIQSSSGLRWKQNYLNLNTSRWWTSAGLPPSSEHLAPLPAFSPG